MYALVKSIALPEYDQEMSAPAICEASFDLQSKIPVLDGKTYWTTHLNHFQRITKTIRWADEEKAYFREDTLISLN